MSKMQARQTSVVYSVTVPGGKSLKSNSFIAAKRHKKHKGHVGDWRVTKLGRRSLSVWPTARSNSSSTFPVAELRDLKSKSSWSRRCDGTTLPTAFSIDARM